MGGLCARNSGSAREFAGTTLKDDLKQLNGRAADLKRETIDWKVAMAKSDAPPRTSPTGTLLHYGKPLREMTGRYRARNPVLVSALAAFDLLGLLHPKREGQLPLN